MMGEFVFRQDETEARVVHRTLCELVEQRDPAVLGGDLGQVMKQQQWHAQHSTSRLVVRGRSGKGTIFGLSLYMILIIVAVVSDYHTKYCINRTAGRAFWYVANETMLVQVVAWTSECLTWTRIDFLGLVVRTKSAHPSTGRHPNVRRLRQDSGDR